MVFSVAGRGFRVDGMGSRKRMRKSILYRLFGAGKIPKMLGPILKEEGVVVLDEGMPGWFIARNVKGPGKRFLYRAKYFAGSLAVTEKRVLGFTFGSRQINILVEDPRISELRVDAPDDRTLSVSFESSVFQEDWSGVLEFRFKTDKARRFLDALTSAGARPGPAQDGR